MTERRNALGFFLLLVQYVLASLFFSNAEAFLLYKHTFDSGRVQRISDFKSHENGGDISENTPIQVATAFYDAWNRRDMDEAIKYFNEDVTFQDAMHSEPFKGRQRVYKYFQDCADSLPGWQFVIDDFVESTKDGKLGLMWHVEDSSGKSLPFPTKGLSFLKFDANGLIKECTDIPEPTVKMGDAQLGLLKAVSTILRLK
eukprot:CAMPEP_0117876612 /NCGR_PEP_ID=MMETSP0950-20121206/13669_1 /TAXON_ID=44440 /ORGANISM="Chattonella subsalsa, Strain CCMP2191" /LENGTH=199 /DNA_ID=CAMNT_0005730383 /DNA_START=12 /DNA_END=611 /DNA_ORIENTATION=+